MSADRNSLCHLAVGLSPEERVRLAHALILEEVGGPITIQMATYREILAQTCGVATRETAHNYRDRSEALGLSERVPKGLKMLDVPNPLRDVVRAAVLDSETAEASADA